MRSHFLLAISFLAACAGGQSTRPTPDPRSREVSFPSRGLELEGTLTLPGGDRPAPAVILVHGSGPNSRDGLVRGQLNMSFGFTIPLIRELAEGLSRTGFVVLRFDKRTCGPFNGCAENGYPLPDPDTRLDVLLDDVSAGIDLLLAQPEVDPERIFAVGHSEGGVFVPELMTRRPEVKAGVMLAANFRPLDEIVARQVEDSRKLARELGAKEEDIDEALARMELLARRLAQIRGGTAEGHGPGGASLAYWHDTFALSVAAPERARALDRPLLAISGDYDWNVPPSEMELWEQAFAGTRHRTLVLPCITHALNCVSQPDYRKLRQADFGRHVDPSVIEEVANFLWKNALPEPRRPRDSRRVE
ncbi:MAG TPA: alpha/beta fold hydrolase [Vulgatibacter sp.]|nr:alpha/beta fold hydrolase [Vulgatibacter sp.]